jgi:hypothetical protein
MIAWGIAPGIQIAAQVSAEGAFQFGGSSHRANDKTNWRRN